jgi:nucleoside-triphosphatase THEP1
VTDTNDSAGTRLQKTITKIYEAFVPFSQRAKPLPKVRQPELHLELLDELRQEANQAVAELRTRDLVGRPDQGRKVEDLIPLGNRELFFDELGQYLAAGAMARAAHPNDCPVSGCDDRYEWNETEFSRTFVGLKDPLTEYIKQVGEYVGGKKTRALEILKSLQVVLDSLAKDEKHLYDLALRRLPDALNVPEPFLRVTIEAQFERLGIPSGQFNVYRFLLCFLTLSEADRNSMVRVNRALELVPPPEMVVKRLGSEIAEAERFDGFANIWERETARKISELLESKGWEVFVQPVWVVSDEGRGRAVYYDPDYVLVHPDLGIFVLEEKKAGDSVVETSKGKFARANGSPYRWRDPASQAIRKHSGLVDAMQDAPMWKESWAPFSTPEAFPIYWGCVFSNAKTFQRSNLSHSRDRYLLADDFSNANSLHEALRRMRDISTGGRPLRPIDRDLFACLAEVIREVEPEPAMRVAAKVSADEIPPLDLRQLELLHASEVAPAVAVTGPAGSGKSVLALGIAQKWADRGRSVLYVCYNNLLAGQVLRDVRERGYRDRIEVRTYLDLAKHEAQRAGLYPRSPQGRIENWAELDDIGQRALLAAQPRFDAVVIDEAQDFTRAWIEAVSALVREEHGAKRRWLFGDPFQALNIDAATSTSEFSTGSIELPYNHRNTLQIHEAASRLRPEGSSLESRRTTGLPVSYLPAQEQYLSARLFEAIHKLVSNGADLSEIVVLTCTTTKSNPLFTRGSVEKGGIQYQFANPALDPATGDRLGLSADRVPAHPADKIRFDSVQRFKGLDAEFVILVDPPMPDPEQVMTLRTLYVGMTRARTHLTVVGTAETIDALKAFGTSKSSQG